MLRFFRASVNHQELITTDQHNYKMHYYHEIHGKDGLMITLVKHYQVFILTRYFYKKKKRSDADQTILLATGPPF
jgi:hypothetical protein